MPAWSASVRIIFPRLIPLPSAGAIILIACAGKEAVAMEVSPAIDKNWEALKRLLSMLVGMAELGLGAGGQFTLFPQEGRSSPDVAQAEKSKLSPALTLPRHLHRAILRLLRPAESAARRLIIAAARGIVVTLPPFRPRKPKPGTNEAVLRSLGIAVT
ncbi:hypothetical protein RB623_27580, partial [Mesorhizobium sp. LHD-90]|nr:hypothetical protein [Mesorhizobium sp. LHD-90]